MDCELTITLADIAIPLILRSKESAAYFRDYIIREKSAVQGTREKCAGNDRDASNCLSDEFMRTGTAKLTDKRLAEAIRNTGSDAAFAEYAYIIEDVSRCVIPNGCSFFHSVAILHNGGAYLLTGRSGIGKSTQFRNLTKIYPGVIKVINGDKPILRFPENGPVTVHPSPWMGKERWGNHRLSAPLKGIVCLEQDRENRIRRFAPGEAAPVVYRQFLYRPESRETINRICDFEEKMLASVPVYLMTNRGDTESSEMLYESVIGEAGDEKHENDKTPSRRSPSDGCRQHNADCGARCNR